MDDLDHLLAWRDRFHHRLAGGLLAHGANELANDRQRHVCLEQRHPHLAQRGVHILFGEGAAAGQLVEHAREALG